MLDIETLLDYLIDDYKVNIYDMTSSKDIKKGLSVDEAKEWASENKHTFFSFEPTDSETITINVEMEE